MKKYYFPGDEATAAAPAEVTEESKVTDGEESKGGQEEAQRDGEKQDGSNAEENNATTGE